MRISHGPPTSHGPQTSWVWLLALVLTSGVITATAFYMAQTALDSYAAAERVRTRAYEVYQAFQKGDDSIPIATPSILQRGAVLGIVSHSAPLPDTFEPENLVSTALPHGDADTNMEVSGSVEAALTALFAAAQSAGHPLMISSAHRSIDEQGAIMAEFRHLYGDAVAKQLVAAPGVSEHHTGLAVDLSDTSVDCAEESDDCSLSQPTAAWLATHAPDYGFILRYPPGKQGVTGIAPEFWHFRYVGRPLAHFLTKHGLTLEEAHQSIVMKNL